MGNNAIAANDTFYDGDGNEWVLSPIELRDLKELESFFKAAPIRDVQSYEGLSEKDRRYLLDKAFAESRAIYIGSQAFDRAMMSMAGLSHLFYLSVRHHHKDVKKETVERIVTVRNAEEIGSKLMKLMGVGGDDQNPTKATA